jgi:hypothetical protein
MRKLLDIFLGVDPANWAADGEWRIEWLALPQHDRALLVLASLIVGVILILWLYQREGRGVGLAPRIGLASLRGVALLGVVAMLLEPVVVFSRREWAPSNLLVLRDDSQSMDIRDAYVDTAAAARIAEALKLQGNTTELRERTRRSLIDLVLSGDLTNRLAGDDDRHVKIHPFASRLSEQPINPEGAAAAASAARHPPSADNLDPSSTALGAAIREALSAYRGQPVAGILLLTDGQNTAGDSPLRAAEAAGAEGVPISAIALGTAEGPRNVKLSKLEVSPVIFVRDPTPVRVILESRGMERSPAAVVLERRGDNGAWAESGRQDIVLEEEGQVQTVEFQINEERPTRLELRARVADAGVELTEDDNVAMAEVRAIRQKIRVLLIASNAFPEVEFLRNALLRDTGVSVSTWLQSADATYENPGTPAIRRLPQTQEEINDFDCVVLYDPDPSGWPGNFPDMIANFVADAGGGLVFIAGERWTKVLFDRQDEPSQAWLRLLPVVVDPGLYQTEVTMRLSAQHAWRLQITPEGQADTIFLFADNRDDNARVLASLPGMFWHFPVTRAKPGATILARHGDPRMRNEHGGHVLLATQLAGPGRTFFVGFDSTYRWRYLDEQYFDGFWARLIDRAGRNKQLGGRYPFTLASDRASYRPGSQVRVTARFDNAAERDAGLDVLHGEIEPAVGEPPIPVTLQPSGSDPTVFETTFSVERAGPHVLRVWAGDADLDPGAKRATLQIPVELPSLEYERPAQDRATLQAIARASGGKVFGLDQIDQVPSAFTTGKVARVLEDRQEIWDAPLLFGGVLALLFAEWVWRKRVRLV